MHFYAPEAHIMPLTVVSWFLISFVMGGERPEQGEQVSTPLSVGPETSLVGSCA